MKQDNYGIYNKMENINVLLLHNVLRLMLYMLNKLILQNNVLINVLMVLKNTFKIRLMILNVYKLALIHGVSKKENRSVLLQQHVNM